QGTRPAMTTVPTNIEYGAPFTVLTSDASQITKVRLIRTGAATHSFDQNARSMELSFTIGNNSLCVNAPAGLLHAVHRVRRQWHAALRGPLHPLESVQQRIRRRPGLQRQRHA